jgi:hypothetical protein
VIKILYYITGMNNNKDSNHSRPFLLRDKNNRPNVFHPTLPGAVGSMESPYRDGRDTVYEAQLILEDTITNIRGTS